MTSRSDIKEVAPPLFGEAAVEVNDVSKVHAANLFTASHNALIDMFRPARQVRGRSDLRAGEYFALQNISFDVRTNEFLGILGGPGSGKSSLANVLAGQSPVQSGTVTLRGRPLLISRIGSGLRPMLSVTENARFKAALLGIPTSEVARYVDAALTYSRLQAKKDVPLFNLSPRETRQLCVALSLLAESDVMIFDNILPSGDEADRARFRQRLEYLKGKRTVIFMTTKPAILADLADRVLVLNDGQIEALDEPMAAIDVYRNLTQGAPVEDEDLSADMTEEDDAPLDEPDETRPSPPVQPLRKKGAAFDVRELRVGDDSYTLDTPRWYWLERGERLSLGVTLECREDIDYSDVRISLHAPKLPFPLAEYSVSLNEEDTSLSRSSVRTGETIAFDFEFDVPDLPSNVFGLTLAFVRPHYSDPVKPDIYKVLIFHMKNAATPGRTTPLRIGGITRRSV